MVTAAAFLPLQVIGVLDIVEERDNRATWTSVVALLPAVGLFAFIPGSAHETE